MDDLNEVVKFLLLKHGITKCINAFYTATDEIADDCDKMFDKKQADYWRNNTVKLMKIIRMFDDYRKTYRRHS